LNNLFALKWTRFNNAGPVKALFNFRLGDSNWALSLGEYLILLVAVLGGWLAGHGTSQEPAWAGHAATHHMTGGANATGISSGVGHDLASQ
jgi:hypothetical protein